MASKGNVPPGEKSRFRFILVEGDVAPGELQLFAQTIAAAVRPPQPQQLAPPPPSVPPVALAAPSQPAEPPNLFNGVGHDEENGVVPEPVPATKPANGAKRKLRTPQLVPGLEFATGEKPLATYISEVNPTEHSKRYLAITYWLKEYRGLAEVSGDHIHTG